MASEELRPAQSTLGVDSHVDSSVLPRMSDLSFFSKSADGGRVENKDVFMFAYAVGVHHDMAIAPSSKVSGGYLRTTYFSDKQNVLMRAVHYGQSDFTDSDSLRDQHATYELAGQYANGGFQIIEGDLDQNMESEELANSYIQEMDKLYEQYTGKAIDA